MRRNSTATVGALHPFLFMLMVYVISFVLAFFVCRMIYFSINPNENVTQTAVPRFTDVAALR